MSMSSSVVSRFSTILGVGATRSTYARLTLARFYAAKKGKAYAIAICTSWCGVMWPDVFTCFSQSNFDPYTFLECKGSPNPDWNKIPNFILQNVENETVT